MAIVKRIVAKRVDAREMIAKRPGPAGIVKNVMITTSAVQKAVVLKTKHALIATSARMIVIAVPISHAQIPLIVTTVTNVKRIVTVAQPPDAQTPRIVTTVINAIYVVIAVKSRDVKNRRTPTVKDATSIAYAARNLLIPTTPTGTSVTV